jgi:hypothetical protein
MDDRQQVRQLPDELIRDARHAIENLVVDDRTSKGLAPSGLIVRQKSPSKL